MGSEPRRYSLDEVFDFRSGLSKSRTAFGKGYPFLTFKDVFYNIFVPGELGDLVESSETERANGDIKRGDVFLTRTSETQHELGMSCVALADIPDATFNGFTKRLRPKSNTMIAPEYAGYFFRSPDFRESVTSISTLSTRASLNEAMLAQLHIVLPDVDVQRSIGAILKTLDDKIDLLRKMNRTLEDIARAVFRAWFVDFEPGRAKAAGANSFRGMPQDLFDSLPTEFEGTVLGEVPKGWSLALIRDVVELRRDSVQPFGHPDQVYQHFSLPAFDREQEPDLEKGASIKSVKFAIPESCLLFSKLNPRIPRIWIPSEAVLEHPQIASTEFLVCVPRAGWSKAFAYFLVKQANFIEQLSKQATGTSNSHQRIKPAQFEEVVIVVPPERFRLGFDDLALPIIQRLVGNRLERARLSALRDALLPKLISGELKAPSLEALGLMAVNDGR